VPAAVRFAALSLDHRGCVRSASATDVLSEFCQSSNTYLACLTTGRTLRVWRYRT